MLEYMEWLLIEGRLDEAKSLLIKEITANYDPLYLTAKTVFDTYEYGKKLLDSRLKDRAAEYFFKAAMICVCEELFPSFRTKLFSDWEQSKDPHINSRM